MPKKRKRLRKKEYVVTLKHEAVRTAEVFVEARSPKEAKAVAESLGADALIWNSQITAAWPTRVKLR